jgi:hypothetical protein
MLDPKFELSKLTFVLEAKGTLEQSMLEAAQSNVSNAKKHAHLAGYNLFKTQLMADQSVMRKSMAMSIGEMERKRSVLVRTLEAHHHCV